MVSFHTNITGIESLQSGIARTRQLNATKQGLLVAGGYLVGIEANYPPQSGKPMIWVSAKQRRGFFAKLRAGEIQVPYQRTFDLAASFGLQIDNGGLTINTGTNSPTARFTHDPQAAYHAGNWRTIAEIATAEEAAVVQMVTDSMAGDFE